MKEKKYLNLILIIPIIFSIFIVSFVLFVSNYNSNAIIENHFKTHLNEHLKTKEEEAKQKVENIFKYIGHVKSIFPNDILKQKNLLQKWINYNNDLKSNIFILDCVNLNGGDRCAKILINPNIKNQLNLYLDESTKDINGKEVLNEINKNGESFVTFYLNIQSSNENIEKTSYLKYHPEFNWIIATEVTPDNIYNKITIEKEQELENLEKWSLYITFISILTILILTVVLYYFVMKKLKLAMQIRDKKIAQENENYKILFNQIPNATWIIDVDNAKIVATNDASIDKYGYTREEFLNLSVFDLDPSSEEEIIARIKEMNLRGKSDFEALNITKSGEEINVAVNAVKIFFGDKEYFLAVNTNITDRIKAQKKIEHHADVLNTIVSILQELISNEDFNSSVDNILKEVVDTLDVDRVYIFENSTIDEDLVCSQRFEYVKSNIAIQIDNPELQNISYNSSGMTRLKEEFLNNRSIEGLIKDFSESEKKQFELQMIKSIIIMPIWFKDEFWGFIGFDDYTNERVWSELEREVLSIVANSFIAALSEAKYFKNLKTQVASQIEEIRKKDAILLEQSKLAQMGEMLNMIAHQWRQPLNAMSASAINLSMKNELDMIDKNDIVETSEFIQNQTQNMSKIINDFMLFNKPEINKEFSLHEAVFQVTKIISSQLKSRNIILEVNIDEKLNIFHNSKNIEHVLLNILMNSRDAFENKNEIKNKTIKIFTTTDENSIFLHVEDNAGGIPEEIIDKIFNPYFTTKEQGKGTGIGLYMSKQMLEGVGGCTINVEVIDGHTLFIIRFANSSLI